MNIICMRSPCRGGAFHQSGHSRPRRALRHAAIAKAKPKPKAGRRNERTSANNGRNASSIRKRRQSIRRLAIELSNKLRQALGAALTFAAVSLGFSPSTVRCYGIVRSVPVEINGLDKYWSLPILAMLACASELATVPN